MGLNFDKLSSMLKYPKTIGNHSNSKQLYQHIIVLIFASAGTSLFEGITYFFDLFFKLSLRF